MSLTKAQKELFTGMVQRFLEEQLATMVAHYAVSGINIEIDPKEAVASLLNKQEFKKYVTEFGESVMENVDTFASVKRTVKILEEDKEFKKVSTALAISVEKHHEMLSKIIQNMMLDPLKKALDTFAQNP